MTPPRLASSNRQVWRCSGLETGLHGHRQPITARGRALCLAEKLPARRCHMSCGAAQPHSVLCVIGQNQITCKSLFVTTGICLLDRPEPRPSRWEFTVGQRRARRASQSRNSGELGSSLGKRRRRRKGRRSYLCVLEQTWNRLVDWSLSDHGICPRISNVQQPRLGSSTGICWSWTPAGWTWSVVWRDLMPQEL